MTTDTDRAKLALFDEMVEALDLIANQPWTPSASDADFAELGRYIWPERRERIMGIARAVLAKVREVS